MMTKTYRTHFGMSPTAYVKRQSKRYRVRVTFPPKNRRNGFLIWADSAKEARALVMEKGFVVRHVREVN